MSEKDDKRRINKSKGDARARDNSRGKPPQPRRPGDNKTRRGPREGGSRERRNEFSRPGRSFGPRMELHGNTFYVFVGVVEPFADDVIRNAFVLPAIDLLNQQDKIDTIVFKAKGQAINVAVRAALLLENVVGVMQKAISISSEKAMPRNDKDKKASDDRRQRFISSIEISMKRF